MRKLQGKTTKQIGVKHCVDVALHLKYNKLAVSGCVDTGSHKFFIKVSSLELQITR